MHKILQDIETGVGETIRRRLQIEPPASLSASEPPDAALGDVAFAVCFELARTLRRSPRAIAEELRADLSHLPGVVRVEVAGAGYLNLFLHRATLLNRLIQADRSLTALPADGKIIVEHTNINPNKAAHIGHLRNAVLGDTLVRALRYLGHTVEVQNYIDDTGVQLADLVVGFQDLGPGEPAAIAARERFDHFCWDLYARVTALYEAEPSALERRRQVLQEMEQGDNPTAALAADLADRIVRCHLATMARLGVHYQVLPRESDILRLRFWDRAFEMLRAASALQRPADGKNAGCWVMDLSGDDTFGDIEDTQKVLVRSNNTVTYTGKDIAYQLWKFGRLARDFHSRPYLPDELGETVWRTGWEDGDADAPSFGAATTVYNVIDRRQAYPQKVVAKGLAALGFLTEARHSIHFAYEMVALTPACAEEMGMTLNADDRKRPYVEMSGRRGLGVKADDLIDRLIARATAEIEKRNPGMNPDTLQETARTLAVGALRYFLLRFTRNRVIAFDFSEVLSFEGETGPYVQYSVVRARNILRKVRTRDGLSADELTARIDAGLGPEADEIPADEWELARLCARLDRTVRESVDKQELSGIARHAFALAQAFNAFYHRFPVLAEPDPAARRRRLVLVGLFTRTMLRALGLMGITVPDRM
ncbi:MAG: arginine--tRNA ligase [Acidobacteriota bacterium]